MACDGQAALLAGRTSSNRRFSAATSSGTLSEMIVELSQVASDSPGYSSSSPMSRALRTASLRAETLSLR